jgi:hypothetical protein
MMGDPVGEQLLCEAQENQQLRSGSVSSSALSSPPSSILDPFEGRDSLLPETQRSNPETSEGSDSELPETQRDNSGPQALISNKLHDLSTIAEIEQHLYNILLAYGAKEDTYWLDVRPVGFKDGEQKRNWKTFEDTQKLLTFSDFLLKRGYKQTPKGQYTTLLGFFCTWSRTWVGLTPEQWKKEPWHAWAAALISTNGRPGKDLLIWDCNGWPQGRALRAKNLLGQQQNLLKRATEAGKINNVWFGGQGNFGKGHCVRLTADWIAAVCVAGGLGSVDTLEEKGYKKLAP